LGDVAVLNPKEDDFETPHRGHLFVCSPVDSIKGSYCIIVISSP
jgi:hypothetical protein